MADAAWMPHVVEGKHAHCWTSGDYEISPLDDELRPRYVVKFKGDILPGEPVCLARARQRAEGHMTMNESDED